MPSEALAERLARQVDVDAAGEREGDDQRRRGKVARAREGMDPALEVAIPREHGRDDEVVLLDGGRDRGVERAGVADARRAAVAREREAELLERRHQACRLEIPGDRLGARRQRRLDGRLDPQSARHRVSGEQPRPDHHGRVGRVGAGGDRGDRHRARADRRPSPGNLDLDRHVLAGVVGHADRARPVPGPRAGRPPRAKSDRWRGTTHPRPPRPHRRCASPRAPAAGPRGRPGSSTGSSRAARRAGRGPADAAGRPPTARRTRGRARGARRRPGRRRERATGPASSRSARRAQRGHRTARSGGGRPASRRRSGRAWRSPRTRGSCC